MGLFCSNRTVFSLTQALIYEQNAQHKHNESNAGFNKATSFTKTSLTFTTKMEGLELLERIYTNTQFGW